MRNKFHLYFNVKIKDYVDQFQHIQIKIFSESAKIITNELFGKLIIFSLIRCSFANTHWYFNN